MSGGSEPRGSIVTFVSLRLTKVTIDGISRRGRLHRLPTLPPLTFAGAYETTLSRGFGRCSRPTFPPGRPS
jgi:hypothetical protein